MASACQTRDPARRRQRRQRNRPSARAGRVLWRIPRRARMRPLRRRQAPPNPRRRRPSQPLSSGSASGVPSASATGSPVSSTSATGSAGSSTSTTVSAACSGSAPELRRVGGLNAVGLVLVGRLIFAGLGARVRFVVRLVLVRLALEQLLLLGHRHHGRHVLGQTFEFFFADRVVVLVDDVVLGVVGGLHLDTRGDYLGLDHGFVLGVGLDIVRILADEILGGELVLCLGRPIIERLPLVDRPIRPRSRAGPDRRPRRGPVTSSAPLSSRSKSSASSDASSASPAASGSAASSPAPATVAATTAGPRCDRSQLRGQRQASSGSSSNSSASCRPPKLLGSSRPLLGEDRVHHRAEEDEGRCERVDPDSGDVCRGVVAQQFHHEPAHAIQRHIEGEQPAMTILNRRSTRSRTTKPGGSRAIRTRRSGGPPRPPDRSTPLSECTSMIPEGSCR